MVPPEDGIPILEGFLHNVDQLAYRRFSSLSISFELLRRIRDRVDEKTRVAVALGENDASLAHENSIPRDK